MSTSSSFTPSNSPPSSDSGDVPPPVGQAGQPQHVDGIQVVIERPGGEAVERLTSSDSSMDTASEGSGDNQARANREGVNGNGQRTPRQDRLASTLSAYERLRLEAEEAREIVRRNENRMVDLLREEGRVPDQVGAAQPQARRPEDQLGQASTMQRHGRSVPPNQVTEPQASTEETSGAEYMSQRGNRVFQELKSKLNGKMETFENLYHQVGLRPANRQLLIKTTQEGLKKMKKEYLKSYEDLQEKSTSRGQREDWNAHLAEGLERIDVAVDNLTEKLEELGLDSSEDSVSSDSSASTSSSSASRIPDKWHGPRAPELKMPYFNGVVAEFAHWEQLFDHLIGDRPDMKGAAKMSYLLASVGPAVEKQISRLGLTDAGYKAARALLTKKYGRADLLIHTEITTLTSSAKTLEPEQGNWDNPMQDAVIYSQRVRDTVARIASKDDLGDIFIQIILKDKMPPWMYTNYDLQLRDEQNKRQATGGEMTWAERTDHLINYVEGRLATKMTTAHRYAVSGINLAAKKMVQKEPQEKPVKIPTTAAFLTTGAKENGSKACCFCDKEGHKPELCPVLKTLTPQDASKICGNKRVCKRCFKTGHPTTECLSGITCERCEKDNHHTVLHFNSSG